MTVQRYFRQAQLTLLTEKRAAFCHLDLVQVPLSSMLNTSTVSLWLCSGLPGAPGEPACRDATWRSQEGEESEPGADIQSYSTSSPEIYFFRRWRPSPSSPSHPCAHQSPAFHSTSRQRRWSTNSNAVLLKHCNCPDLPADRVPWPGRGVPEGCHPSDRWLQLLWKVLGKVLIDRAEPGLLGGEEACRAFALPPLLPSSSARLSWPSTTPSGSGRSQCSQQVPMVPGLGLDLTEKKE